MCTKCFEWLPCTGDYFHKNAKNKKDGLNPYCRICHINKIKKYIKDNPNKKKKWDYKDFEKPERKVYFKELTRKRLDNGKYKAWQQSENGKISAKKNQDKRKHKKHEISKYEWISCKEYFNNSCAYCGLPISQNIKNYKGEPKNRDFDKEHFDDNGANDLSNCVPSCHWCNSEKKSKCVDEWYNKDNPKFDVKRKQKIFQWLIEGHKEHIRKK